MDEKNVQIQSLQQELDQKNIKITELTTTVNTQSSSIAEQQNALEEQKKSLEEKTSRINDLNRVWYCVATSKELKTAKIITNTGLFQSKKVLDTDFDKNAFTQADLRVISSIPTNSKKIKMISSHPEDSYKLVTDDNKSITIEISNATKFWSVSKYLVVQI